MPGKSAASAVSIPPIRNLGRDTAARRAAREHLAAVTWNADGTRRLPTDRALVEALHACDARDPWWVFEMASPGPVYFLPTREWVKAAARVLRELQAKHVLEVGAGDGFVSRVLADALPGVRFTATDTGAWVKPAARMNDADREEFHGVDVPGLRLGTDVLKMGALAAVKRFKPDVVLTCWAPPGTLVERMIRAPVKHVLDIAVDGDVCGSGERAWRYRKEFLSGPVEDKALCRLDARPREGRATRVTLYMGGAHEDHGLEDGWA